jgi:hypothetical protein
MGVSQRPQQGSRTAEKHGIQHAEDGDAIQVRADKLADA